MGFGHYKSQSPSNNTVGPSGDDIMIYLQEKQLSIILDGTRFRSINSHADENKPKF